MNPERLVKTLSPLLQPKGAGDLIQLDHLSATFPATSGKVC
jgi:hypothetical protein